MALFSERYGYTPARSILQVESMDSNLRMGIYNALYNFLGEYNSSSSYSKICRDIWSDVWHGALDKFPRLHCLDFYSHLKHWLAECTWYEPYDLIEFVASECQKIDSETVEACDYNLQPNWCAHSNLILSDFAQYITHALEHEDSGYRLIETRIVPITNDAEIDAVENALEVPVTFSNARHHIEKALTLFAHKPEPDSTNTVKESISAVEAAAQAIIKDDKATLGAALKLIENSHGLHPALAKGWSNLYGFTSDAGGIRHAEHSDDIQVDGALAKYMLVSCSAFVNYLIELDAKQTITDKRI